MTDRRVFFAVVAFLGGTLLLSVAAIAVLAGLDRPTPGILENVAVGCLTGLAGLLARGPATEPQEVVRQPAGQAVPVEDVDPQAGHVDLVSLCAVLLTVLIVLLLLGALPGLR